MVLEIEDHIRHSVAQAIETRNILDVPAEALRIASITEASPISIAHGLIEAGIRAKLDVEMVLPQARK